MSLPELIIATNRQKVARIAQEILDGRIGVIEASRALLSLSSRIGVDERDDDFAAFAAIDTNTDDLPVGDVRKHWAPDALAKKDAEIAHCEALYRDSALEAASHLVARFAHEKPPASAYDYYTPDT